MYTVHIYGIYIQYMYILYLYTEYISCIHILYIHTQYMYTVLIYGKYIQYMYILYLYTEYISCIHILYIYIVSIYCIRILCNKIICLSWCNDQWTLTCIAKSVITVARVIRFLDEINIFIFLTDNTRRYNCHVWSDEDKRVGPRGAGSARGIEFTELPDSGHGRQCIRWRSRSKHEICVNYSILQCL